MLPLALAFMAQGASTGYGYYQQERAEDKQNQQYKQYLDQMKQMMSREFRYSPDQLAIQDSMLPLQAAMLSQATGATGYSENILNQKIQAKEKEIADLDAQAATWYSEANDKGNDANLKKRRRDSYTLYPSQRQALVGELDTMKSEFQAGTDEGTKLYNALLENKELDLNRQWGAERGALDTGLKNSLQSLGNQNRTLMGNAVSGHVLGGGSNQLYDLYMRSLPQLETARQDRLGDWKVGQAQQAMGNLMNMGYGEPMGNMPYTPPQPPTPSINMAIPNTLNQLGSLATMYAWNRGTNKPGQTGQQVSPQVGPGGQLVWPGLGRY